MSDGWQLVTIDEIKSDEKGAIAIGPFGSRMKSDCYVDEGIPVIRGTNITDGPTLEGNFVFITQEKANKLGSSNVYQYDLVFPHRGSIGEVGIILKDEHYVISSSLMKLTCDRNRVNPRFLYYFFKSNIGRHELLKNASQVGTPGIGQPLTSLRGIEFRLPPIDVQDQIEEMLTSLDDKIELNRQTNQTLEQIAQAIFKSWFVDFEPVKAKAQIRASVAAGKLPGTDQPLPDNFDIETAIERAAMCAISGKSLEALEQLDLETQQQLKTTAALFPDALVDSELGEIPEGWEVCTLDGLCALNVKSWTKKDTPNMVWYVDLANTKNGVIEDAKFYSWNDAPSRARRIVEYGDTIIGTVRPGNRSYALIGATENQLTVSTGFAVLSPKKREYLEFLFIASTSDENIDRLAHLADGGAYPAVRPDIVTKMQVTIPNALVMSKFSKLTKPLFLKRDANLASNDSLKYLRDTLLPKLLSGELTLDSATIKNKAAQESCNA